MPGHPRSTPIEAPATPSPGPGLRTVVFLAGYLALAWVSFVYPMRDSNITPWSPEAALGVGFLLIHPAAWPAVWLAAAAADALVATERMPVAALVAASGALTAGYAATAAGLRRWVGMDLSAVGRRSALVFLGVIAGGALISSALRVGALWAVGLVPFERVAAVIHRASIGDGVGLIVTLPVLLVLAGERYRAVTRTMLHSAEWWLIAGLAVVGIIGIFQQGPGEQFKYFYFLFVPVVWASIRFGAVGAVWSAAVVQALLIVAVQTGQYQPVTVFELQVLMATLSATGILLGAIVDERVAAEEALRASLRLAAAADMAAALAHELNQPLTAISTYARACQVLAHRLGGADPAAPSLADVADKLSAEAARAGEVVHRLRRFFRERSTQLEPTEVGALLREALRAQATRAEALRVRLVGPESDGLPPVWVDRVQLAVVLRNLLANAIDAACDPRLPPDAERWVRLRAGQQGSEVLVSVLDSGRGLGRDEVRTVFEARGSDKPGGMGIGLVISRAILEAHGGRLWAEPGPGGRFRFSLPIGAGAPHDA